MIGHKFSDGVGNYYDGRINKVSKNSPENNSETLINDHDKEIHEKDISPEKRPEIIDDLRLK